MTFHKTGRISFQYDPAGNKILRTDARNLPTSYAYDPLNRVSGYLYPDGSRVTLAYDAAGQKIGMADSTGATAYAFDPAGRQTSVAYPTGQALSYTHDPVGNRATLTDPNGYKTWYGYDAQDRLTSIRNPLNEVTNYTYDPLNREINKRLANGMNVQHVFDPAGRNTAVRNLTPFGPGSAVFSYSYDPTGQALGMQEIDGTLVSYTYDPNYQLTGEQRDGANAYDTAYQYDPVGNRTVKNDSGTLTSYTYDPANQLLNAVTDAAYSTFTYDPNGNTTSVNANNQITTNTWDFEDRLIGVAEPNGNVTTNTYAADGKRRKKQTSSASTIFVWDGQNVLQETDVSLVTQVQYTLLPGIWGGLVSETFGNPSGTGAKFGKPRFGTVRFDGAGGFANSSFYGYDKMGNVRLLTSRAGLVTDNYLTDAFGREVASSGSTVNPYQFGGEWGYYLNFQNQYEAEMRILEAEIARWNSRIPLGQGGWLEPEYPFVGNNPVGRIDPAGLGPFSPSPTPMPIPTPPPPTPPLPVPSHPCPVSTPPKLPPPPPSWEFCQTHPYAMGCPQYCVKNPFAIGCPCNTDPGGPGCPPSMGPARPLPPPPQPTCSYSSCMSTASGNWTSCKLGITSACQNMGGGQVQFMTPWGPVTIPTGLGCWFAAQTVCASLYASAIASCNANCD